MLQLAELVQKHGVCLLHEPAVWTSSSEWLVPWARIVQGASSTNNTERFTALQCLKALCSHVVLLSLEPLALEILAALVDPDTGSLGHKMKQIKVANITILCWLRDESNAECLDEPEVTLGVYMQTSAEELLEVIVAKMNPHAIALALPDLFVGVSSRKWEAQYHSLKAIQTLAKQQTQAIARNLQSIIPVVRHISLAVSCYMIRD